MARHRRFALVALVSLAIASTGVCSSLSSGVSFCPAVPEHGSCCADEPGDATTCPASEDLPTCRMCDDTVAFLLEGKTDHAKISLARDSFVADFVPRPAGGVRARAASLHLSQISASPPLHLLNVTFRN